MPVWEDEMPTFEENFRYLIDNQIIPSDTKKRDISSDVQKAIANLKVEQREVLKQIASDSKAHIFLHETYQDPKDKTKRIKKTKIIAMGL
jgi:hypothetical protein